jgi:hypothetical protein
MAVLLDTTPPDVHSALFFVVTYQKNVESVAVLLETAEKNVETV